MSDSCPSCHRSLQGEPIPEATRIALGYTATHYSLELARVDPLRDRVVAFGCPFCGHEWEAK